MAAAIARSVVGPRIGDSLKKCKLLSQAALVNKVSSANIYSKTSGLLEERMKPWPYKKVGFNGMFALIDGTTKRFNDNSKMIVVEGPPALNKTKFCQELADEFDMKFVPGFTMDDFYINHYGYDLRDMDYMMTHTRNLSYDEKKFAQDPTGQNGGLDRMLYDSYMGRFKRYNDELAYLFNTGQGVVMERSPHSDFCYIDAAYNQGWISKSTRAYYYKVFSCTVCELLRPNFIIYLDAPVDVVQSKIRARAATTHPWEKNSPVFENTGYLENLYEDLFKKTYLPKAAKGSYVLTYDWSEGGDTEVVVEDMERMQVDYHDKYDPQQKDWRLLTEDEFASKRKTYTDQRLFKFFRTPWWTADDLIKTSEERLESERVRAMLPGNTYAYGYNTNLGDKEPMFNSFTSRENSYKDVHYTVDTYRYNNDEKWFHDQKVMENRKALGDKDWYKV